MNQRRKLTSKERDELGEGARANNPGKQVFVQEWTNADGKPVIVTVSPQ